ncbi:MAG TPA: UDP-2,3-diacylglucosamine diphosphatase [Chthoniobacteraceae bacterium]|jgi:UDP-2,3-diacylglucosamine pyrophosphatase LpxH
MNRHRTGWISDVHLGTRGSQAELLLQFLREHEFETLYVVGDLIDVWALRRGIYWPQSHNDVIQKLLRAGRKGSRIIYIPGNHDEFVSGFIGDFGAVRIEPRAIHTTADGRRLLVIHGHELDTVVQGMKWLAHVGDVGYTLLLRLNGPINGIRKLFGRKHWSLSAFVKRSVKNAVSYIGKFEEGIVRFAREDKVDGVVCGHIHSPIIRKVETMTYYNSGDWVESMSALVEDFEGGIKLITNYGATLEVAPLAAAPAELPDSAVAAVLAPAPDPQS